MGYLRMGIPKELVIFLKSALKITCFIETGTYKAQSAVWASGLFDVVHTIENSEIIFKENQHLVNQYTNISFHYGNSKVVLPQIINNLDDAAIFWLDAHWSGSITYGEKDECPILEEIKLIIGSNPNHIILIDDARLFLSPPPLPHNAEQWPSINEIFKTLNLGDFYIVIYEDVIIAIPSVVKEIARNYFQNISTSEWNQKPWHQIKDGLIQVKDGFLKMFK